MSRSRFTTLPRVLAVASAALLAAGTLALATAPDATAAPLSVTGGGLTATVNAGGGINSLAFPDGQVWHITGESLVAYDTPQAPDSCAADGSATRLSGGRVQWKRRCTATTGEQAELTETLAPLAGSIAWDLDVSAVSGQFTRNIWTELTGVSDGHTRRFWTAWGNPTGAASWADPMQPQTFADRTLHYGAGQNGFSLPVASVLEPDTDNGVSLVQSPADPVVQGAINTTSAGDVAFERSYDEIDAGSQRVFHMFLVPTAADPRPVLGWFAGRFGAGRDNYVSPVQRAATPGSGTAADAISGLGSYSPYPGPFTSTLRSKLAGEDYRLNWELSNHGPYIGMFMPPVTSDTETWAGPNYLGPPWSKVPTSEDVANWKKELDYWQSAGLSSLAYFNVQTFGWNIQNPPPPQQYQCTDADLWKNPNDYLNCHFKSAISTDQNGQPRFVWEHSAVLDPADAAYRQHLLDQAKALLTELPQYSGITVDSLEHLAVFNTSRSDGVAWFQGKPSAWMLNSWRDLAPDLAAEVHGMGKQIWANPGPPAKRIDALHDIDGIYSEFSDGSGESNEDAFLGLQRPVVGWLHSTPPDGANGCQDLDTCLQQFLYDGIFAMGDSPENDHGIPTSAANAQVYQDYGPMFAELRGKRWDYTAKAEQVTSGGAIANVFKVDNGIAVPLIGGSGTQAGVTLTGLASLDPDADLAHAQYILPGQSTWTNLSTIRTGDRTALTTPLGRGAAMVRFLDGNGSDAQVAAGQPVDVAVSAPASVATGQSATVTATVRNRSSSVIGDASTSISVPSGWTAQQVTALPARIPGHGTATAMWTVSAGTQAAGTVGEVKVSASYRGGSAADTARIIAGALLPQSDTTATASSSDPSFPPSNLVDGNPATRWQSARASTATQSITLDLHADHDLAGLTYLPRQDGTMTGLVTNYTVSTSSDGTSWTQVMNGTLNWDAGLQAITFGATNARYIRLDTVADPQCQAVIYSGAELNVVTAPAGWTAPTQPSPPPPPFGNIVPRSQESAYASAAQAGYEAPNAIDADNCTFWHTPYNPYRPLPWYITVDLGATYSTVGLQYLPRQDGYINGDITRYEISTSLDNKTFTVVKTGFLDANRLAKKITWAATSARYVRLRAYYGYADASRSNGLASAADLQFGYQ